MLLTVNKDGKTYLLLKSSQLISLKNYETLVRAVDKIMCMSPMQTTITAYTLQNAL